MRRSLRSALRWSSSLEPVFVALAAPVLLFPTFRPGWTAGALIGLLVLWLLGWVGTGRAGASTPLNLSLLVLVLAIPMAVWASPYPDLTLPKLTGLILGLAAFRAITNGVRDSRGIHLAVGVFLALGLGMVVLGVFSVSWGRKLPALGAILTQVPNLISRLPGAKEGVNPNELGGGLTLFLPVALVASRIEFDDRKWLTWAVRCAAVLLSLLFAVALFATQSRSAWIGVVAGLGVMVLVRWRRARWLALVTVPILLLSLWYLDTMDVIQIRAAAESLSGSGIGAVTSLEDRLKVWSRALFAIQDFSFTGCGLGAFRRVVHLLYPPFLLELEADFGHALNMFIQVALDLGLGGLIAYLALVGGSLWLCWGVVHSERSETGWLALGVLGAQVAFHVYGLTDAIALGAKPGVALWILLALAVALWTMQKREARHPGDAAQTLAVDKA